MGAVGERPFSHLFFHDGALYQVSGGAAGSAQRTILTIWTQKPKYNYWRLHAKDSGNSDGYIEVGRVMAGRYIEPDRNISDGFKLQRKDTSRIQMLNGLTGNFTGRDQHEVLEFRYNNVPETYVDQFRGLFNSVGNHKPILVSLFPETRPHHNSYYCQMTSPLKQQHFLQRHFDLPDLTFEEKV
jgi:hypothetical protein